MPRAMLTLAMLCAAFPAAAQVRGDVDTDPTAPTASSVDTQVGRTATISGGQVGQRQSREEMAPNAAPLGRIQNRVANRVQNRIRSRIDRHYDPQANATSPFEVADDRARTAGQRTPR